MSWDKFYKYRNCSLWLPFTEGLGTVVNDQAYRHEDPFTLHGTPAWAIEDTGLIYLNFNHLNPDWLDQPSAPLAPPYDFTGEDFAMGAWARISDAVTRTLICRGVANTDGWFLQVNNAGRVSFATCQAGATQTTLSTALIGTTLWYLIGVSRAGASIRTFVNGQDVTDAPDTHISPLTNNRELHIGILDDEVSAPWRGRMWNVRIWPRYLQPWEWLELFNMERHWMNV